MKPPGAALPGHWPRGRLLVWLVLFCGCLAVIAQTRFTADLSAFLPAAPDPAQRLLVDQLRNGPVARLVLLGIETPGLAAEAGVGRRAALSRTLATQLRGDPAFTSVLNGDWQPGSPEEALLFRHRYLLGDAVDADRFTVAGLRDAIAASLASLASPAGLALRELLPRDPGGEILRIVERLEPESTPADVGGVWGSADRQRALLLVMLAADGSDLDGQQAALARIDAAFTAALGQRQDARLLISGAPRFALESRAQIRGDVERLSLVGAALILALLLLVYRSPRLIACGLLPVLSGAVAAIAMVSLAFGEVHGLTLGFGIALMSEALDYAIYVFVQGRHPRLWQTLRLGALTSLVGFGALLFSGFPGLAQLGLFAGAGVLVAALVSGTLLGVRFPVSPVRIPTAMANRLQTVFDTVARWPMLPPLAAALALAVLVGITTRSEQSLWQSDLAALSPVGAAAAQLDASMRADLRAPDLGHVVAAVAPDADSALAAASRIDAALQPLVARGDLAGFDSPSRLLPDRATQIRRRDALPDPGTLRAILDEATRGSPLRPARLAPFVDDVAASRELEPLQPGDFAGTALDAALSAMLIPGPDRVTAVLPLRLGVSNASGTSGKTSTFDAAAVRAVLPPGATLIDIKAETDRLYRDYLQEAIVLVTIGLILIVVLMVVLQPDRQRETIPVTPDGQHRRASAVPVLRRIVLPLAAALLVTVALLIASGIALTLLHLVGLLLTVAVGSNYALFLYDNTADAQLSGSVLLACTTTTIGYGVLAFASAPVLAAIGQTVGPGAVLTLFFCACLRGPTPRHSGATP